MYSTLIYIWIRNRTLSYLGSARRRQTDAIRAPMPFPELLAALPSGDGGRLRDGLRRVPLATDLKIIFL
jgi:hypothetical protein